MQTIDIQNWKRKEHYEFFSKMASPYFGIVTEVDCTMALKIAKQKSRSFFAHYMHKSMLAVNLVEELRLRIIDEQVVLLDEIHSGTTIGRKDGTFGFAFIHYNEDFDLFNLELQNEISEVQSSTGLRLNNEDLKNDLVRYSTLPWHSFTGLLHPTNFNNQESVPKITFGKFYIRDDKKYLPISIEAHHGLVDGFHLTQYLELFQNELDSER